MEPTPAVAPAISEMAAHVREIAARWQGEVAAA